MTIRDTMVGPVDFGRQLVTNFGLRRTQVLIRSRVWSGGKTGKGTPVDTDLELGGAGNSRPKVVDMGGGRFHVQRITPPYGAGQGFGAFALTPVQSPDTEIFAVLNGPDGFVRECHIVETDIRRPFEYTLILEDRR